MTAPCAACGSPTSRFMRPAPSVPNCSASSARECIKIESKTSPGRVSQTARRLRTNDRRDLRSSDRQQAVGPAQSQTSEAVALAKRIVAIST